MAPLHTRCHSLRKVHTLEHCEGGYFWVADHFGLCVWEKDGYDVGGLEIRARNGYTHDLLHVNFLHRVSGRCANQISRNSTSPRFDKKISNVFHSFWFFRFLGHKSLKLFLSPPAAGSRWTLIATFLFILSILSPGCLAGCMRESHSTKVLCTFYYSLCWIRSTWRHSCRWPTLIKESGTNFVRLAEAVTVVVVAVALITFSNRKASFLFSRPLWPRRPTKNRLQKSDKPLQC